MGIRHLWPEAWRRRVLHLVGRYAPWEAGFDLTPPEPGPDEETGPPDFVGIGAQKSGTTWWYELLSAHPGVYTRAGIHKERHYLDRFASQAFASGDIARYSGWFPRRPGTLTGEWTPDYMVFPWAPALLAVAAPDTKLIAMLRDPVERLFSGLAHEVRMGERLVGPVLADAFERGLYHQGLRRWLEHFRRDQLLVLQYERCLADPEGQLSRTYSFLGLTQYWVAETERPPSPDGSARRSISPEVRERLAELYAEDVRALISSFDIDASLWPSFAYLAGEAESATPSGAGGASSPTRRA